jgi:hypothetical protein
LDVAITEMSNLTAELAFLLDVSGRGSSWAIDPSDEKAKVYTPAGARSLAPGEPLTCPELLGDFELHLPDLWS